LNSLKERKALSTLLIIIIVVATIVIAIASAIIFLGSWFPLTEVTGSGDLITQQKDFSGFSAIDVSSGFEVEISQSSFYSISVTADDNIIEYIQISKTDNTLKVRLQAGISYQSITLQIEIEMPELNNIELSGGSQGTINDFASSNVFSIDLSGGSQIEGSFTTTENVNFELYGGSQLDNFVGEANDTIIELSQGSQLDLSEFVVNNSNVNLNGGSQATINLNGRLDANLIGGSTLEYIGEPTMGDIEVSGGSTVNPK
jgi:uncharacterized protein YpmB